MLTTWNIRSAASLSILVLLVLVQQYEAANILGFFPTPSKSHLIIHSAIADALAEDGHNVTVIGTFPNVYPKAKYHYIHINGIFMDSNVPKSMINKPKPLVQSLGSFVTLALNFANASMSHSVAQQLLHDYPADSFDLIILGYTMNDFILGLSHHFQCPIILSFMLQPIYPIHTLLGNPIEVSYVPTLFSGFKQPMKFFERIMNFVSFVAEKSMAAILVDKRIQQLYDYHFPSDKYPPLDDLRKNVSLVLCNHHFSQGPIRPNVPGLIEIGGIQIKEKQDPLPADLLQILNNAKHGVIYFSLGTVVQSSFISKEKLQHIFDVLSKLPYTVLWKWNENDIPGKADNIHYRSWLPQDDVLAHPNIKLFITHCGQGSVVESQYHGVPMLGIPLFGDQPANALNMLKSGFGLSVKYLDITVETFRSTLLEVLQNPKYKDAVQQFSRIYRDRPMTPRQTAVYWINYVLRHKGAKHLQSPAVHLNTFQLLSLDVIGFLAAILAVVLAVFIGAIRWLLNRRRRSKKASEKSNKKQN